MKTNTHIHTCTHTQAHTHIIIEIQQFNSRANYSCGLSVQEQRKMQLSSSSVGRRKAFYATWPFFFFQQKVKSLLHVDSALKVEVSFLKHCWSGKNYPLFNNAEQRNREGLEERSRWIILQINNPKQSRLNWFICTYSAGSKNRDLQNLSSQSKFIL